MWCVHFPFTEVYCFSGRCFHFYNRFGWSGSFGKWGWWVGGSNMREVFVEYTGPFGSLALLLSFYLPIGICQVPRGLMLLTLREAPHGEVIGSGSRLRSPPLGPTSPTRPTNAQSLPALGKALLRPWASPLCAGPQLCPSTVRDRDFPAVTGLCGPAGSQQPAAAATLQRPCYPCVKSSALSRLREPFPAQPGSWPCRVAGSLVTSCACTAPSWDTLPALLGAWTKKQTCYL